MRRPCLRLEIMAVLLTCATFVLSFEFDERSAVWSTYHALDDQTGMEAMIRTFEQNEVFCDQEGDFLPICLWPGVGCTANGHVQSINWNGVAANVKGGHLLFDWLPELLQRICITDREVEGELETELLPLETREVILSGNRFDGSLDCTQFPPKLEVFDVHDNLIHGPLDLTRLPRSLRVLRVDSNRIHQDMLPVIVPPTVAFIDVRHNHIGSLVTPKGTDFTDSRILA